MGKVLLAGLGLAVLMVSGCNQMPSTADDALVIARDAQAEAEGLRSRVDDLESEIEDLRTELQSERSEREAGDANLSGDVRNHSHY